MNLDTLYNKNAVVNYKHYEREEDETTCQTKYREQLLNALNLTIDKFDNMTSNIDHLYKLLVTRDNWSYDEKEMFNTILLNCADRFHSRDISLGFLILFSYDYFDILFKFLNDYFYNNEVNNELLKELKNKICN